MLKVDTDRILMIQAKQCLTNSKLAAKADISRQTLANILNKRTRGSIATIGCIANALGVEVSEILKGGDKNC